MKLLHIASRKDGCTEEALVPVPDAYSAAEFEGALLDAEDFGVEDPRIIATYVVAPAPHNHMRLDEFRVFVG